MVWSWITILFLLMVSDFKYFIFCEYLTKISYWSLGPWSFLFHQTIHLSCKGCLLKHFIILRKKQKEPKKVKKIDLIKFEKKKCSGKKKVAKSRLEDDQNQLTYLPTNDFCLIINSFNKSERWFEFSSFLKCSWILSWERIMYHKCQSSSNFLFD